MKHLKTTLKIIKSLLVSSEIRLPDQKLNKLFDDKTKDLTLSERQRRFHLIKRAKVAADAKATKLNQAYQEAMIDVVEHGGTLR